MKKTITLLIALFILQIAEVQASKLFLRTSSARATATISGQQYFTNTGEFVVTQLPQGRHFISVTERRGRSYNNNRGHRGQGQRGRGYQNNSFFRGKIFIPHRSNVFARITPRGQLIIERVVPIRNNQGNRNYQRNGNGRDYGRNGNAGRDFNRDRNNPRGMANFNMALDMIRDASFESNKKTLAKQYINRNNVSSRQVLQIIRAMDFESSRLQIAKFAYDKTYDPENYFMVNKGFQFQSSINALNRYMRN